MQRNGGGQIGSVVKNIDTGNTSVVEINEKKWERTAHETQTCDYTIHATHIMPQRAIFKNVWLAEFSFEIKNLDTLLWSIFH